MSESNTQRLIEIVGDALSKPPAEREAFLRAACPDPASLAEALSLLASLARAGAFMDSPTQAQAKLNPQSQPGVEHAGSVIDRYTLLEQIGAGGFGVVFLAEQREPVRRRVALKIIKPGMDSAEVVARFEAERQALAIMDHPNVAKVLDGGVTPSGRPYFVMELVPGEPITAFCDRHTYTNRQRLGLFIEVCHAVQHAHMKGIIHRDIKPSNILVTMSGDEPVPKVIDFGVAKAISQSITEKTIFTATGQLIGTPEYMSPEQAEMGALDIDTRTDVYSLGVVLYELLTGSTPLAGSDLRSKGFGEIQRIIREVDPPTPSTRLSSRVFEARTAGPKLDDPTTHAPGSAPASAEQLARLRGTDPASLSRFVRGELDWIVMKALDKDRARRYGTADGFAADVRRYLAGDAVLAAPASAAYRARKFVRQHRGPVVAAALVAATLIAGIAGTTVFALREADARSRAERAESVERQRGDELNRVAKFQSSRLGDLDPSQMAVRLRENLLEEARDMAKRLGDPDAAPARAAALDEQLAGLNFTNVVLEGLDSSIFTPTLAAIRKDFADQPAVRAQLLQTTGDTMRRLGLDEQSLPVIREAYEVGSATNGEGDQRTLEARALLSYMLRRREKLEEAEREIRATLGTARRSLGDRHRVTLTAMQYLGDVLNDKNQHAEAEGIYREALQSRRAVSGEGGDHDTAQLLSALSETLFRQGRLAESEAFARESLAMNRRAVGEDHPSTLNKLNNLATILNSEKKYDEGMGMLREVVDRTRRVLGDKHPELASKVGNLGASLLGRRNYEEAEPLLIEAVDSLRRARGPMHPNTLSAVNNLAYLYYFQGQFDRAAATLGQGVQLTAGGGPGVLQTRAVLLHHHAEALLRAGKGGLALAPAQEAWDLYRNHPDWKAEECLHSARILRDALIAQPDLDRAAGVMAEVIDIERRRAVPDDDRLAVALAFQGSTLLTAKKFSQAESAFRECLTLRQRLYPDGNAESWLKYRTMTQLASAILARDADPAPEPPQTPQRRSATLGECEKLLVEGYKGLKADPHTPASSPTSGPVRDALASLVKLYETWDAFEPGKGHGADAARWKAEVP